ncbi:MAG: hypothetical protein JXO22_04145 [Phycisphaerae bacterium]|nr:hypothetical protein [Phycisphaerae bacterium]
MSHAGIAAILSFFLTGLGQIYNGQIIKGLLLMAVQAVNIALMWVLIGFLLWPIVWIYGMIDAYDVGGRRDGRIVI